ncbi:MAG: EamA family transporter [Bacteroidales bacterium]
MLLLFASSFFGIFLNQTSYIIGLSQTSPIDSSIIATSTPLLVMIIAFFALKEPISLKKSHRCVLRFKQFSILNILLPITSRRCSVFVTQRKYVLFCR